MRTTLALAAAVGVVALVGCSSDPAADHARSTAPSASAAPGSAPSDVPSGPPPEAPSDTSTGAISDVADACATFNSLIAEYAAIGGDDPNAYEDIYLRSEQAREGTEAIDPDQVHGLFAALSLLAIDHASAAASGREPAQSSRDAVIDAVLANVGHCSSAGVDLRL